MKTSSSAVVERPRDALCPSVVSFNSVIPRAQSFIVVTSASDLPLRTILFCCLRRNVEASCHKHFVVVSREKQMPPQQRLVSSTCHGPSQLRVLHLAVELEPFTARDGARYWLRIAIFAYPTCT